MIKKTYEKYKTLIYILITVISIFLITLIFCKASPFGSNSLIAGDIAGQYIPFWAYFKDCLLGKQSALFTFSKLLGGNMIGLWAYYLISPFNLLFMFFSKEKLALALVLVTALKILACATTMYIFLKGKIKNKIVVLILCICYAFQGYIIAFQINVMWLENLILLPLIALGIEKIINKDEYKLYTITLALSLIFNFYIGFSTAIFSGMYYIFIKMTKNDYKSFIKKTVKFAIYSILSISIAAFILLPVIYTLKSGRGSNFSINIETMFNSNFKLLEFFSKTLFGTINNQQVFTGLPNIYIGIPIIILVEMYFLNRSIPVKNKIISLIFITIMILSFKINIINLMWHGFKNPIGFLYRYSFIFTFLLIVIAAIAYGNIEKNKTVTYKSIIIIAIINISGILIIKSKNYAWISEKTILISIALVLGYLSLLLIYIYRPKKIIIKMLAILCVVEITSNYIFNLKQIEHQDIKVYTDTLASYNEIIEEAKKYDKSFYRMEKTTNFYLNDSLLFNYNGIGHSSSTFEEQQTEFIKKIGYNWYIDFASYGFGNTIITDSLLGIKYKISKDDEMYYEKVKDLEEENKLYKNKYDLQLGYITNKKIEDINLKQNPFEIQEKLLNEISENNIKYFNDIKQEKIKLVNVENNDGLYRRTSKIENESYIELTYDTNKVKEALYFFVESPYALDNSAFKLYVNDKYLDSYIGANKQGIIKIDNKNKKTKIKLALCTDEKIKIDNIYLKEFNLENFENAYKEIKENGELTNIEYKNNKLTASIETPRESYLFTTIPYIEGWKAKVDGKQAKIENSNGFITIKLDEGTHNIELKFSSKGLKEGIMISIISLIIFIITIKLKQQTRRKNEKIH